MNKNLKRVAVLGVALALAYWVLFRDKTPAGTVTVGEPVTVWD